jgi:hypothetical protein
VCVTEREGKFVLLCVHLPFSLMEHYQPFTLAVIFRFILLGCARFVLHFYVIMLIIVTGIEFLVARITDRVDSPFVTKTVTPDWLRKYWSMPLVLGWPWTERVDHGIIIHPFFHYWYGQFTNHNDTDAKCSSVTSRSDGCTDCFVTAIALLKNSLFKPIILFQVRAKFSPGNVDSFTILIWSTFSLPRLIVTPAN